MSGTARTLDWRGLGLTAIAATLLTAVIGAPTLGAPSEKLFGHEIVGRHHDPFTIIEQYAAGAIPPPYFQPATDLPGIGLAWIVDAVAAYNALVLATFVLAALFAYAHADHLIGSRPGAVVAALLFAFSPFHIAHAAYHVHIAQIQWIPLFFLCLWRLLERPSAVRAMATGLALLVVAAASLYLGFMTAAVAPIAAAAYIGVPERVTQPRRAAIATGAALIATGAIALGAVHIWAPQVLWNPDAFAFPAFATDQHSARWWSFVVPPAAHPWFGGQSAAFAQSRGIQEGLLEQQVSLGVSVIGLALVPVVLRHAQHASVPRLPTAPLIVTAVAAGLCSLPAAAAVFHAVAPMFRAYARFGVITSLMVSTLAGAGVALLLQRRTRPSAALAGVLIGVACFEYLPAMPAARDTLPTAAHRLLAGVARLRLFDCTTPTPGSTAGVAFLMRADVAFPAASLADCAEPQIGSKLAAFDFTHLVVRHEGARASWLAAGGGPDGTRVLRSFADATAFAVTAAKPPVYVAELPGFYEREFHGRDSWRWMSQHAAITIVNVASPTSIWVDLELEAFERDRIVRAMNGWAHAVTVLKVARGVQWHTLGPFALVVGANTITLVADTASTPREAAGLPDPRPLSIRLRRWAVRRIP